MDRDTGNGLDRLLEEIESQTRSGYSDKVIDHAMNPRNVGRIDDPSAEARYTGPCGDTMVIWIGVEGNRIERSGFWTDGCGSSIATGSVVTDLATGRTVEEAMEIDEETILSELEGLPEESEHCALLASRTLKLAIRDYRRKHRPEDV